MKKIATILGARPQFVKASMVSRQLQLNGLSEIIIHTGQHFEDNMSDIFFREMGVPQPAYNLGIHGLTHGAMTGRMIEEIEKVLIAEKPGMVMVYGDTNSTLAGALAAVKMQIPVAHVEAGLRSFNMAMPEEINRILTDRISSLLFCPTDQAVENLRKEGFAHMPAKIVKNGDVMQDAAIYFSEIAPRHSQVIANLGLTGKPFILCTIHRQENTDDPARLSAIIDALNALHTEIPVVLPLHPRTRNFVRDRKLTLNMNAIEPVGYLDMIELLKHSHLVITDSGGLQKEAFFFGKHCLTARDETEWIELVDHGFNRLVGASTELILSAAHEFLAKSSDFRVNLYGNGNASAEIAQHIAGFVKG